MSPFISCVIVMPKLMDWKIFLQLVCGKKRSTVVCRDQDRRYGYCGFRRLLIYHALRLWNKTNITSRQ